MGGRAVRNAKFSAELLHSLWKIWCHWNEVIWGSLESVQLGKVQRHLETKPDFLALFPLEIRPKVLGKQAFCSSFGRRELLQGCLWHFGTSRVTETRKVRTMRKQHWLCLSDLCWLPYSFQLFKIRYCLQVQGKETIEKLAMCADDFSKLTVSWYIYYDFWWLATCNMI